MSHVIVAPSLDARPRQLASVPVDRHDPAVRDLVDRAVDEAFRRGHADGRREGLAAAREQAQQLVGSITTAFDRAVADAASARRTQADDAVALALTIADAILGREPHDGGAAVAAAVAEVLGQLVDPAPTVHVHPDDHDLVAKALADRSVTVVVDATLQPGDARVRGGWADVDLTRAAAWRAIREALDVC